ncbi:MAG: hypothetical protein C4K47_07530 [Candidatus Thorarchaeota archaeon]|nr:MAG: hypothetical protein C4K47_07530 [Candidatus Thorarchaeota archaeon]
MSGSTKNAAFWQRKEYRKVIASTPYMTRTELSSGSQPLALLLVGILSMVFAEALSGSSVLWFLSVWSWLVTLPLYWSHTLLFLNIAFRLRRTSISDLYLLGVLFGLYESWVTKVVWAGYFGQLPGWGTVLGFAVAEVPVIVFFWHPVMSFIVPILIFQIIAVSTNGGRDVTQVVLPSHIRYLRRSKRTSILFGIVFVGGAAFLSANSFLNVLAAGLTAVVSLLAIVLVTKLTKRRYGGQMSINSLKLGRPGFSVVTLYVLLLYIVTFPLLRPEAIPSPATILWTLCLYALVAMLVLIDPAKDEISTTPPSPFRMITLRDVEYCFGALTLLIIIMCAVPIIDSIVGSVLYLMILVLGPSLFVWTGAKAIAGRARKQMTGFAA